MHFNLCTTTYLPKEKKTILEKILTVFDQRYIIDNEHLLDIPDKDIPDFLYGLTRRLQQAQAEEELEEIMYIEDEYFSLEERLEVSEKILEEKERVLMEKNKDLEAKDKDLEGLFKSGRLSLHSISGNPHCSVIL